jgi:FkbM family methyltransferase
MQAGAVQSLPPGREDLDPERVVEVDADVGSLWLERDAEILTRTVMEVGAWAPDTILLMRRLLKSGMTFVDAGANVGYHSVLASKLVGSTGRVLCIEADPANVAILRANLWKHGCENAKVFQVAAWFEQTRLTLHTVPEGGAASSVAAPDEHSGTTVPACRLDQLIDGPVDYLKVDCEATDHLVISGATGLFDSNPRMVATVEFVPDHASHTGETPQDILSVYRRFGLHPYEISRWGALCPTTYERLASSGSSEELVVIDFALSRRRPMRLVLRYYLLERLIPRRAIERLLGLAGDLLEHVPERIRPKIRRRDRVKS